MNSLFGRQPAEPQPGTSAQATSPRAAPAHAPLAVRMRPRTIDEIVGQTHIVGPGKLLRRMLAADALSSLIFHGPPGTGKTTLAEVVARQSGRYFERENAAAVGVARIREIAQLAERRLADGGRRTVLFLDEIHRFSRAQQDVLLGDVERGLITLIGATTENPLFAVNSALVSRSTLFRLEPLSEDDIIALLRRAAADRERGLGHLNLSLTDDALAVWARLCDGDARRALTALEIAAKSCAASQQPADVHDRGHAGVPLRTAASRGGDPQPLAGAIGPASPHTALPAPPAPAAPPLIVIDRAVAEESIQQKAAVYDGTGDEHYDAISAMIKSVRGSDPDAALYWMARMLEAGEDPRFIARRLAILASEDIGNADPRAIMVAAACWELVERIGMPEARITLAQCLTYLATCPKSNASYTAIDRALDDVRQGRTVAVPNHIKDGNVRKAVQKSAGGAGAGRTESYRYTHEDGLPSASLGIVGAQDYLGVNTQYYQPPDIGHEKVIADRLREARALRQAARGQPPTPPPPRPGPTLPPPAR